jgi:hypothetical protein
MKAYTTFQGAQRAAKGKPIVRLLDDPSEIWIVIDRLFTDVMVFTTDGGLSRKYEHAGSAKLFDIAAPSKGTTHDYIAERVNLAKTYAEDGAFRTAADIFRELGAAIDAHIDAVEAGFRTSDK